MTNVTALSGGLTYEKEVNNLCITVLEDWLELARNGQITGVGLVSLEHDGSSRFMLSGKVGGFSMLGSVEMLKAEILDVNRDDV